MAYGYITLELLIGYILLLIVVKLLGKTELNQITPFEFISSIVLGNFICGPLFDSKLSIIHTSYGIIVWGFLIYLTKIITQKSLTFRSVLNGKPSILIKEGTIIWKEMKKNQININ